MGIAAAIISGLIGIGTTVIGGKMQKQAIEEGQREARGLRLEDIEEQRKRDLRSERLTLRQIGEQKRQFDISTRLKEQELGMLQEKQARTSFRDQVSRLTQVIDKNEALNNLFINRLRGLRG